jgi:cell division protein FtsB
MSDLPADYRDRLNLREQIARIDDTLARIDRQREETQKFVTEQHKLIAEVQKLNRDRWLAPVLAIAAVIGGLLGVASFIAKVVWGP